MSVRGRLGILLADLLLLSVVIVIVRDVFVQRILHRLAQGTLNAMASASVESIGALELSPEGNIVVLRPRVITSHAGTRRLFFRSERIEIHVDGNPLRDANVRVMRVDLHKPEMYFIRESDGDWNALWALRREAPPVAPPPPTPPPSPPPTQTTSPAPVPVADGFPRNGVHIHGGMMHVVFVAPDAHETVWDIGSVEGVMRRERGALVFDRWTGTFHGGAFKGEASIPSMDPFVMEMKLDVAAADIARMASNVRGFTRPVTGQFDMVLTVRSDHGAIGAWPVAAGRASITGGKLWDLPAFVGVLAAFALTEAEDKIIDQAQIEFTVERTGVRIDRMDFLGRPLSLFGGGTMDLDGRNLDVTLIPRLGKSLGDVLPLAGHVLQALLDVAKGAIVPVKIGGSFWSPHVGVDREAKVPYAQEKK